MELNDLQQAWNDQQKKIDRVVTLNAYLLRDIQVTKTKSKMNWLLVKRLVECLIFLVIIASLSLFMVHQIFSLSLLVAALILNVFSVIGCARCVSQILLIVRLDYSKPITAIQRDLETIRLHVIMDIKLIVLSLPFYMAYVVLGFNILFDIDIVADGSVEWWIAHLVFSLTLVPLVIWIWKQLSLSPSGHSIIRSIVEHSGGKELIAASRFVQEIKEFEHES